MQRNPEKSPTNTEKAEPRRKERKQLEEAGETGLFKQPDGPKVVTLPTSTPKSVAWGRSGSPTTLESWLSSHRAKGLKAELRRRHGALKPIERNLDTG